MKYSIEELAETFAQHSTGVHQDRLKWTTDFQENYPGEDLPDYMKDDFNFPKALEAICLEIIRLKGDLK